MNAGLTSIVISGALSLMVSGWGHQATGKDDAMAGGAQVTEGAIITTSTGAERNYALTGNASMRRFSNSRTTVTLDVAGLHAHEKYPSHVHNLPCDQKGGGGHYQYKKGGKVDAVNEIWLTFTTNAAGDGSARASHGRLAQPDAQSIVIHDSTKDKARIGCINLT